MNRQPARTAMGARTRIQSAAKTLSFQVERNAMLARGAAPPRDFSPDVLNATPVPAPERHFLCTLSGDRMNRVTETVAQPVLAGWKRGDALDALLTREWLVTNAL